MLCFARRNRRETGSLFHRKVAFHLHYCQSHTELPNLWKRTTAQSRDVVVVRIVDRRRVSTCSSNLVELFGFIVRGIDQVANSSPLVRRCAWPALSDLEQFGKEGADKNEVSG